MIHVERGPAPVILESPRAKQEYQRLEHAYRANPDVKPDFNLEVLKRCKASIKELFHGKCAYCESALTTVSVGNIEHFRPKAGALNLDGKFSREHYWWLTFEWSNILFACQICDQVYKASRFPVAAERAPVGTFGSDLLKEGPLLLDPCHDAEPIEKNLLFAKDGTAISDTQRGRVTIDVLGLNRPELVKSRSIKVRRLRDIWNRVIHLTESGKPTSKMGFETIRLELSPDQEYLGIARQFARVYLNNLKNTAKPSTVEKARASLESVLELGASSSSVLRSTASVKRSRKSWEKIEREHEDYSLRDVWRRGGRVDRKLLEQYFRKRRVVRRVEIHNYRGVPDLTVEFPESLDASPWMMLLGENGTGKSSILHAIAVTLMGAVGRRQAQISPQTVLPHGAGSGWVKVHLTNVREPALLQFKKGQSTFGGNATEPKVLLLGYGATRLLPRPLARVIPWSRGIPELGAGPVRVDNLLQRTFFLRDATRWLGLLDDPAFQRVKAAIGDLLFLRRGEGLARKGKIVSVKIGKRELPLNHLSDGFQCLIALATDVLSVLDPLWTDGLRHAESVVLIDEIDAHLHPRWRMEIVERLRKCFPRVQFITSTHDPLCLRGLRQGEVTILRCTPKNKLVTVANVPSPEGMSADQLLTSEHFGLSSTIDPVIERLFRQYYQLLRKTRRSPRQDTRLAEIKRKLDAFHHMGRTVRERIMFEAIDRYLATPTGALKHQTSLRNALDLDLARLWTSDTPENEITRQITTADKA